MEREDTHSRASMYSSTINRLSASAIRFALALNLTKRLFKRIKDKLSEMIEVNDTMESHHFKLTTESESARSAYNFMKSKIQSKDDEINALSTEVERLKRLNEKITEISSRANLELQMIKDTRHQMQHKALQAHPEHRDKALRCNIPPDEVIGKELPESN